MKGRDLALIGGLTVVAYLVYQNLRPEAPGAFGGTYPAWKQLVGMGSETLEDFLAETGLLEEGTGKEQQEYVIHTANGAYGEYLARNKKLPASLGAMTAGQILAAFTSLEEEEAYFRGAYLNVGIDYDKWVSGKRGYEALTSKAQQEAIATHNTMAALYAKGYITPQTVYAAQNPAPGAVKPATDSGTAQKEAIYAGGGEGAGTGGGYDWSIGGWGMSVGDW